MGLFLWASMGFTWIIATDLNFWTILMFSCQIWPIWEKNTCFCTFQCGFSPNTLVMYLNRFIFVSIHGIHLNYCFRTPLFCNFDVFLPDLTSMWEKYLFLCFPMRVFIKNLGYVLNWVYFCEHPWDPLEVLWKTYFKDFQSGLIYI